LPFLHTSSPASSPTKPSSEGADAHPENRVALEPRIDFFWHGGVHDGEFQGKGGRDEDILLGARAETEYAPGGVRELAGAKM